jgi:hypothetical protein
MGVSQTPTLKSCFSRDAFEQTPVFPQTVTQSGFEQILKCVHIVKSAADTYKRGKSFQNSLPTAGEGGGERNQISKCVTARIRDKC